MKNKYILYFFLILAFILLLSLYMIEIPAPSILITEEHKLAIK